MRAALLMFVIACGGGLKAGPAPTPVVVTPSPVPACEAVIRTAATRIATESERVELATAIDRTAAVMIASCEAEAWPTNVRACIAAARLDVDLDACTEELTYRQHARLHAKLAQVTRAPPPPPTPSIVQPVRPQPTATAKLACAESILDPRSAACRQQFCDANTTDVRCALE